MINRIILVGRLTRDPESSYTGSGIPVSRFRIAVDRPTRNPETNEKETDFIDIVAWHKTADFVREYLGKGRLVGVDGRLQVRSWTAQDGSRRWSTEVVADSVQGLDRARDAGPSDTPAPLPDHEPPFTSGSRRTEPSGDSPREPARGAPSVEADEPDPFDSL